jgi:hypothetical protein
MSLQENLPQNYEIIEQGHTRDLNSFNFIADDASLSGTRTLFQ